MQDADAKTLVLTRESLALVVTDQMRSLTADTNECYYPSLISRTTTIHFYPFSRPILNSNRRKRKLRLTMDDRIEVWSITYICKHTRLALSLNTRSILKLFRYVSFQRNEDFTQRKRRRIEGRNKLVCSVILVGKAKMVRRERESLFHSVFEWFASLKFLTTNDVLESALQLRYHTCGALLSGDILLPYHVIISPRKMQWMVLFVSAKLVCLGCWIDCLFCWWNEKLSFVNLFCWSDLLIALSNNNRMSRKKNASVRALDIETGISQSCRFSPDRRPPS